MDKSLLLMLLLLGWCNFTNAQPPAYHMLIAYHDRMVDTTHYYDGDTLYTPWSKRAAQLTVCNQGGAVAAHGLRWQYGSAMLSPSKTGMLKPDSVGYFPLQVFQADTLLMTLTLAVYKMPLFYFQRGYDYDGEYGFDDSTHQYPSIRNNPQFRYGYQVRQLPGDTAYFVPWMSLLHGQAATIRYRIKNWTDIAGQDPNGYWELRPEAGSNIRINGQANPRFYFQQLKTKGTLDIDALQWVPNPDSLRLAGDYSAIVKGIDVITHTGDTIGKLHLSCARPETKQIVFVYVNMGRGYDSSVLSRGNMLRQLNKHSHNQLMRQWVLNKNFPDTLNITAAYFAQPRIFKADTMPELLKDLYKAQTGVDIEAVNRFTGSARSPNYIRFLFISHLVYPRPFIFKGYPWVRWMNGITAANNGCYAALFETANLKTVCHELGHMLKHDHTQDMPYHVVGKVTHNVMDYSITGLQTIFNRFWYAQWIKTY